MATSLNDYILQLQQQQEAANKANQDRLNQVTSLYDEIIAMYAPGGSFGAGVEKQLAESKKTSVGQGTQALVNSGFANSTMMANLGTTWEKGVGEPARLNLESLRAEKMAGAKAAKASMIENVQDTGPDDSLIAQLISQASQGTGGTVTTIAPSKLKLDSSSGGSSKDSDWDARMAAWRAGGTAGNNSSYWNNGQWTGGSSIADAGKTDTTDSELQALVNQNTKTKSKSTNPYLDMSLQELMKINTKTGK